VFSAHAIFCSAGVSYVLIFSLEAEAAAALNTQTKSTREQVFISLMDICVDG